MAVVIVGSIVVVVLMEKPNYLWLLQWDNWVFVVVEGTLLIADVDFADFVVVVVAVAAAEDDLEVEVEADMDMDDLQWECTDLVVLGTVMGLFAYY